MYRRVRQYVFEMPAAAGFKWGVGDVKCKSCQLQRLFVITVDSGRMQYRCERCNSIGFVQMILGQGEEHAFQPYQNGQEVFSQGVVFEVEDVELLTCNFDALWWAESIDERRKSYYDMDLFKEDYTVYDQELGVTVDISGLKTRLEKDEDGDGEDDDGGDGDEYGNGDEYGYGYGDEYGYEDEYIYDYGDDDEY
ncbi:hypothetical protein AAC387_Pa03g1770 [Persea americana]